MMIGEVTAPHTPFGNPADGTAGGAARSQSPQQPAADEPAMRTPGWTPPAPDAGAAPTSPDAEVDPDPAAPDADAPPTPDAAVNDDAQTTLPDPPPAGTLFGSCAANTDCTTGLVCTSSLMPFTSSPRGYCTAFCGSTGSASDVCPQPADGTVRAICRAEIALCVLDDCERSECPAGMSCRALDSPGNGEQTFWCSP